MPATPSESSTPGGDGPAKSGDRLDAQDVAILLEIMAEVASLRNDPRRWRMELLLRLVRIYHASAAVAAIVKLGADLNVVQVVSVFDAGFKTAGQRQAFLDEMNDAPFEDPLSRRCFKHLFAGENATFTAGRRKLVDDSTWYKHAIVERYRHPAHIDTCLMSVQRDRGIAGGQGAKAGAGGQELMVLGVFRGWGSAVHFVPRDRILLDTLHVGLGWMYRAESAMERLTRATALTPRLRQTLDYLLAGDTERQVASKMEISIHTVHDYVKALYVHFGVSSRGELLARWIQSGESLPRGGETGG